MWCNTLLQCGVVDCLAGWDEQVQGKNYLLCGVIPYSSVVWWIALQAGMNKYKGRTTS